MVDKDSFTHSMCFCGEFWAMVDCYRGCRGWLARGDATWMGGWGWEEGTRYSSLVCISHWKQCLRRTYSYYKSSCWSWNQGFQDPLFYNLSLYHGSSRHQYPQFSLIPSSTWVLGALAYKQPKKFFPPFRSLDLPTSVPLLVWFSLWITLAFLSPVLSTQPHYLQNNRTTPVFKVLLQYLAHEATFPDSLLFY